MRYRVMVSNGYDSDYFYTDDKSQAHLLFNMAVESKMFSYVALDEVQVEYYTKREWADEVDAE